MTGPENKEPVDETPHERLTRVRTEHEALSVEYQVAWDGKRFDEAAALGKRVSALIVEVRTTEREAELASLDARESSARDRFVQAQLEAGTLRDSTTREREAELAAATAALDEARSKVRAAEEAFDLDSSLRASVVKAQTAVAVAEVDHRRAVRLTERARAVQTDADARERSAATEYAQARLNALMFRQRVEAERAMLDGLLVLGSGYDALSSARRQDVVNELRALGVDVPYPHYDANNAFRWAEETMRHMRAASIITATQDAFMWATR